MNIKILFYAVAIIVLGIPCVTHAGPIPPSIDIICNDAIDIEDNTETGDVDFYSRVLNSSSQHWADRKNIETFLTIGFEGDEEPKVVPYFTKYSRENRLVTELYECELTSYNEGDVEHITRRMEEWSQWVDSTTALRTVFLIIPYSESNVEAISHVDSNEVERVGDLLLVYSHDFPVYRRFTLVMLYGGIACALIGLIVVFNRYLFKNY